MQRTRLFVSAMCRSTRLLLHRSVLTKKTAVSRLWCKLIQLLQPKYGMNLVHPCNRSRDCGCCARGTRRSNDWQLALVNAFQVHCSVSHSARRGGVPGLTRVWQWRSTIIFDRIVHHGICSYIACHMQRWGASCAYSYVCVCKCTALSHE